MKVLLPVVARYNSNDGGDRRNPLIPRVLAVVATVAASVVVYNSYREQQQWM